MARPTKATYHRLDKICELRSQGLDQSSIAKKVGIDRLTLRRWIKKGKTSRNERYKRFYNNWLNAEEQYRLINPPKNTYNPRYARETFPGYNKFKNEVLARDGYSCVCCGYDDLLEVHHIYGVKENPNLSTDVDNGVTLCKYCHQKYHHIYSRYGMNANDFNEFIDRFGVSK